MDREPDGGVGRRRAEAGQVDQLVTGRLRGAVPVERVGSQVAEVIQRSQVRTATSNRTRVVAETRLALAVPRPKAFCSVVVNTA